MIPVEATETLSFTPKVLEDMENPPVFILRAPDDRHIRRYDLVCGEMNLEQFTPKQMNAERRKAIAELYGDQAQKTLERFNAILASNEQEIELSTDDRLWIDFLEDKLFDEWPPLARMKAKNGEWWKWAPEVSMTTMIVGWTGLTSEFKKDGLYLSAKALVNAANEMVAIEKAHTKSKKDSLNLSYMELWAACQNQMNLTDDEEKNSHAPSKPSLNQDASTENNMADGASTEGNGEEKSTSSSSPQTPAKPPAKKA